MHLVNEMLFRFLFNREINKLKNQIDEPFIKKINSELKKINNELIERIGYGMEFKVKVTDGVDKIYKEIDDDELRKIKCNDVKCVYKIATAIALKKYIRKKFRKTVKIYAYSVYYIDILLLVEPNIIITI